MKEEDRNTTLIGTPFLTHYLAEGRQIHVDNKIPLQRVWKRGNKINKPLKVWYVGFSTKFEGTVYPGGGSGYDYEPPSFRPTKSIRLARVKLSKNSNDKFVFFEDLLPFRKEPA